MIAKLATIGTIVLASYMTYETNQSDFNIPKTINKNILLDSKQIFSNEDILNKINLINLKKGAPLSVIIDNGEHGAKTYKIEYTNFNKANIDVEMLYISKFLSTNNKEETKFNKIELLKKYEKNFIYINDELLNQSFSNLLKNKEFKLNILINDLAKKFPNNPIYINMSFSPTGMNDLLKYDYTNNINPLFIEKYQNLMKNYKKNNFEFIQTIYNNPNIKVVQSAGNNIRTIEKNIFFNDRIDLVKNFLHEELLKLSSNDLSIYNNLRNEIHKFVTSAKNYNVDNLSIFKRRIDNISKKDCEKNQLVKLIKLSIIDYGVNYQQLNLIEQLEYLKIKKNINLIGQIDLAKAMNLETLENNIDIIGKKYNIDSGFINILVNKIFINKSKDIESIEDEILFTTEGISEDFKEISKLKEIISEINNTKKDLLFNTTYGNIINPNKYSEFYKISPINHDMKNIEIYDGTSAAAPQGQSDIIIEDNKHGIHNSNYSIKYLEIPLSYNYDAIGLKTNILFEKENNLEKKSLSDNF